MADAGSPVLEECPLTQAPSRGLDAAIVGAISPPAATDQDTSPRKIEWGGYVVGDAFGSCATHPMFRFLSTPPEGYCFTSRPRSPSSSQARLLEQIIMALNPQQPPLRTGIPFYDRAIREMHRVIAEAVRLGAKLPDACAFFARRHPDHLLHSTQTARDAELLLLPTVPFGICAVPWMVEIEDNTTLFFPYLHNGGTSQVEIERLPCYPVVRALLSSDLCRGIITHSRSTAASLPRLFRNPDLKRKVFYVLYGKPAPNITGKKPITPGTAGGSINLLFTSSWHQWHASFYKRGGLEVLEAFGVLAQRYPQLHLTIRSRLPKLNARHAALVREHPRVRVLDDFVPDQELHRLMLDSDIFLLPAAHLHVASIVDALGYGLPVVAADGWGISEYVRDGIDGYVVPGRSGAVCWEDPDTGLLREDYSSIAHPEGANATIVAGLIDRLTRLIEDVDLRRRLSANARSAAQTLYSLGRWNQGLKEAFDSLPPVAAPPLPEVDNDSHKTVDANSELGVSFRAYVSWVLKAHQGKRIVCYGAGYDLITMLEQGVFDEHQLVGVMDDARAAGSQIQGRRVIHPRELAELKPDLIVITSSSFADVLRQRALGMLAALDLKLPII